MMLNDSVCVDRALYAQLLQECGAAQALSRARQVHSHIVEYGSNLHLGIYLGNHLLGVYDKCGSPDDARWVFNRMTQKDVISWNTMISAYSQLSYCNNALQLFEEMNKQCLEPTRVTFLNTLKACSNLSEGERVYTIINNNGLESDLIIGNALISTFRKCRSLDMAVKTFLKMRQRDAITWTTMIATHIHCGQVVQAWEIFKQMIFEGVNPTIMTYATILNACTNPTTLREGELLHIYLVKAGLESFEIIGCALLSMYGKCGRVYDALWVFDGASKLDAVTWNSMISVCINQGCNEMALHLYQQMHHHGIKPNSVTFVSTLDACTKLSACEEGMMIHISILDVGMKSDAVWNALLNMYGSCGSPSDANSVFERMPKKGVVSWTSIIQVFVQSNRIEKAFQAFQQMQREGVMPNRVTLLNIVKACIDYCKLIDGRLVHTLIVESQLDLDLVVCNALITLYGNCGSPMDAHHVFTSLSTCDVVSWTAVITAHAQNDYEKEAIVFFAKMHRAGVTPTNITYISVIEALTNLTALDEGRLVHFLSIECETECSMAVANAFINFYAKCGKLDEASYLFNKMPWTDIVSWSALITAYANQGEGEQAFDLLLKLEETGLKPDDVTFVSLLSACSHAGLVAEGFVFFHLIKAVRETLPSEEHCRCIVDMLSRAGWLNQVEVLIDNLPYAPTFASWMTLLGACRVHSNIKKAERVTEHVLELNSLNPAGYVILSNIYIAAGMNVEADRLWRIMKEIGVKEAYDDGIFGDWL